MTPPYTACVNIDCPTQPPLTADGIGWRCPDCKLLLMPDLDGGWVAVNWLPHVVHIPSGEFTRGRVKP